MEENVNVPQKSKLGAIAFLKVGLFEIGFVGIVLFLLFGILNYFNILSISDAFPQYLSWLPKQTKSLQGVALKNTPTPSPINYSPAIFAYDTEKAETILTKYIESVLKAEFIPNNIDVQQGLSMNGKQENIKYQFAYIINSQKAIISANFIYDENTNTPSDYGIFIRPQNLAQSAPTVALTNSLLLLYFSNPYTVSNCQTKGEISYCENFQTTNTEKIGYGYATTLNPSDKKITSVVFTCFMPKESKYYALLTSCIASQQP